MTQDEERFLMQLRATFKLEADEHLGAMGSLLLQLERAGGAADMSRAVEALFREAHSLKGAARAVNLPDMERVCQSLERVLSALQRREIAASNEFFDRAYASLDGLGRMLAHHVEGQGAFQPGLPAALSRALHSLLGTPAAFSDTGSAPLAVSVREPEPPASTAVVAPSLQPASAPRTPDTVRIAAAKLDGLMTQAEELQALKFGAGHVADELQSLSQWLLEERRAADKRARSARVLRRALERESIAPAAVRHRRMLAQLLSGFGNDELTLKTLADRVGHLAREAGHEQRSLASRADRLLDDMKQVLMQPMSVLLAPMDKVVRDLAHDTGKQAELVVEGATLEVDRRILEQMKVPLVHLMRNAVDHGIETPAERQRAGKPARGHITVTVAARAGNRIEIAVGDDGAGISLDALRARAEKMGLARPTAADSQLADLVFASGLSTRALPDDVSGHGLGLAIVREKVEALGGSVVVDIAGPGSGARFVIVLPATLATFHGLLVCADRRPFVLPSRNVERVGRVPRSGLLHAAGLPAVELAGATLPLASLAAVLGLGEGAAATDKLQIVVVANGDKRVAFAVDEVVSDQEVLARPLALPLKRVRHIAGATVLGAGQVVPLLSVADLLKTALRPAAGWLP